MLNKQRMEPVDADYLLGFCRGCLLRGMYVCTDL
jgi:hypothetical protein